jgi:hypothetical protein
MATEKSTRQCAVVATFKGVNMYGEFAEPHDRHVEYQ